MLGEQVELQVAVPRTMWEVLHHRAQTEHADETTLLLRALEQFLHQSKNQQNLKDQLAQECEELATLTFDDIGTDDEWLYK